MTATKSGEYGISWLIDGSLPVGNALKHCAYIAHTGQFWWLSPFLPSDVRPIERGLPMRDRGQFHITHKEERVNRHKWPLLAERPSSATATDNGRRLQQSRASSKTARLPSVVAVRCSALVSQRHL